VVVRWLVSRRWWAEGTDDEAAAAKLSEAAAASHDWAASNGMAFDHGKSEAALFRERKTTPLPRYW